jgi:ribose transport system ATP-binding protein
VLNLSGGNQQKCLVAMWMGINPQVIIFDEPTRGVDVGARAEIYRKLREFATTGVGIIIISSDLPELIGMCDRVLVMHKGRVAGEIQRSDFSEEAILSFAAGLDEPAARAL